MNRKVLFASISGGVLEIYDFIVYGLMASTLAPLLFNSDDPFSSLIQSYVAFCVGFLARPIGAILFGHLGDFFGRKKALIFSSLLMSISTLALGLIPTYEVIGVWASISVFVIRILQGISVGGEYTGGIIMSVEHTAKERRGAVGAYVVAGYLAGIFLGTITSFLFTLPFMPSWGWRLPFIFGFIIVGIGFYIRSCVAESPEFMKMKETHRDSFFQDFMKAPQLFLACMVMAGFGGVFLYTITVYIPIYLKSNFDISNSTMMFVPILPTFCMMIGVLIFGILSDKLGRIPLMKLGSMTFMIVVVPLVYMIKAATLSIGILALMAIGFISTIYNGPMNTLVVEVFGPTHRYKSAAISYSLGMSLFGGTAPLIAAWLTKVSEGPALLSGYFFMTGLMGWGAIKIVDNHFKGIGKKRRDFTPSFMTS